MSKNDETMTKEEIERVVREHGGNSSMTMMDALKAKGVIVEEKREKESKKSGKSGASKILAAVATVQKFSFQRPAVLPTVRHILAPEERQKALEEHQKAIEVERQRMAEEEEALVQFRKDIAPLMSDLVTSLRDYSAAPAKEQELAENKESELHNRKALADLFNQVTGRAREVAVKCFAASYVLTCPKNGDGQDLKDVLDKLLNYDFTKEATEQSYECIPPDGVRAFDVNYQLTSIFANDNEARDIMRDLRFLIRETKKLSRAFFRNKETEFEAKNIDPMTRENLVALVYAEPAEKSGTIILDIPEQPGRDPEGKFFVYKSGRILAQVSENKLSFVEGIGGLQKIVQRLAEERAFVYLNQLKLKHDVLKDQLERDQMREGIRKNILDIHRFTRLGIRTMREKAEKAEAKVKVEAEFAKEREAVLAMAGDIPIVSNEEFLLEGKPGTILLDNINDPWIRKDKGSSGKPDGKPPIETAFPHARNALVIRQDNGKILVKCPDRLKNLYQGAQEAAHPGDDKFTRLEYPLGLMLRNMRDITKQKADEKAKAERQAKADTETGTPTETGAEA
ncbi:MAG: hypothetical protein A2736_00715 [Candidatus Yanofskybacteria bacterium RIFCSPHIGHO2_01_FULL_41_27]|uniref:Uncharacterized protein n=2 Tax=Candidatus Yanofskyibacteriota TaxID=1752733 RepID=A0A1F8HTT6_9BACT|nr:MAG: hypothetical protein A2736_00715 [Candidatus Yanofskybacteria bacterium RIFCSPHIGHO2_01_FULL_41_27]OGN10403.1 MAG: hypothetical protein A3C64_02660 [Candidatus Yanofskybacteria bacterium RIFCSPHIGHO2_02_FULL_41_12]OGN19903.1 MAG: hypothetical protein A3B00_00140 [Candidatus Yanofskybacteria bacterium RIFCSPLOWO2_01_FULL_41_33]OGN41003.1 MAG: hypothetical protein A2606_03475 [Candidatus Yanofskybacteria bacterium RIFOXYD1_FULL_42_10]